jgi:hypothetical protein
MPDAESFRRFFTQISETVMLGRSVPLGATVFITAILLTAWIIYAVQTEIRTASDMKKAEKIESETGEYCHIQEESIEKMKAISDHIDKLEDLVRKYEVFLLEKNAALRRALLIEKTKDFEQLHPRTQESVRETIRLMREVIRLLSVNIVRDGELALESVLMYEEISTLAQNYIDKLYRL